MYYDMIIIGTGAGGGTLAQRVAPSGKNILILERGDYLPREMDNWDARAVFVDEKYHPNEKWSDQDGKTFVPGNHYYVGGNTKFYGAALFRFREKDFEGVEHVDGISPAWPLSYTDYKPYYLEAEQLYSVHGLRGSDPTEPHEENPYPLEPLPHEPRIQELHDDLTSIGLSPFPLPMGVRVDAANGAAPYILDNFDGFPDPTELKADAHVIGIKPALAHPNVTLKTNAYVEKLVTDTSGRTVTEVITVEQGQTNSYSADIVVVACGAVNSAALLLRSANEQHPTGLGNSSDMIGRNYMFHNNTAFVALSLDPNPTRFGKTLGVNDYYFGADDADFPLGHIQMLGKSRPEQFEGDAPKYITPGFTLEYIADHALDFWLTTEDLPDPNNRVTLKEDGSIQLTYNRNNTDAHDRLIDKLKLMLKDIRCDNTIFPRQVYLNKQIPLAGCAHQCGTVRFGSDPQTSALDTNCKMHDLENLYVVDSSFFVSSTSVNPALTVMANALRVGDHLLDRLG